MTYDFLFKTVLIGDCGVGKTQIRTRYTMDEFNPESKSTIGVEFAFKTLHIRGDEIKAQIWDTSGEERYRAVTSAYYRGSVGAIIVFDVTKYKTFANLETWLDQLRQYADAQIVMCIVGNKIDLPKREVTTSEAEQFARNNNCFYMETSALDGTGVNQAFYQVMEKIYSKVKKQQEGKKTLPLSTRDVIDLTSKEETNETKSTNQCCNM